MVILMGVFRVIFPRDRIPDNHRHSRPTMIDLTLKFLTDEINQYLAQKPNLVLSSDMSLVMGNASRLFDTDTTNIEVPMINRGIMSLINVEEDRIGREQENYRKTPTGIVYQNPPVYLNLYVLFVMNHKSYPTALRWLSYVIQFFQHQNVFTPVTHPGLDEGIEKITVELMSLNFEQSNQLWSSLGGKYLPSICYKIRQVTIDENVSNKGGGVIREIVINERTKLPVS